jgi:hypothetical protein
MESRFPFLFDSISAASSSCRYRSLSFFPSSLLLACFPPPRLASSPPNGAYLITASPRRYGQPLLPSPHISHPIQLLKIPPRLPHPHLPISASYLFPPPSTSESDTLDDGTFSAYSRKKVPRPLPCPHHSLSISISKTPTLSCLLFQWRRQDGLSARYHLSPCVRVSGLSLLSGVGERETASRVLVLFDYRFDIFLFLSLPSI